MAVKKQTKSKATPIKPNAKQTQLAAEAQKRLKLIQSKVAAQNKAKAKLATKTPATKVVKTKKQNIALVNQSNLSYQHKLAVWEETEKANDLVLNDWAKRLTSTKNKMDRLREAVENITIKLLDEAYSIYSEVIKSDLADDFFAALWNQLYKDGIKIQKNTPNASLIIRYIYGANVSTKTISEHAKVLEGADYNDIQPQQFSAWLKHKTMTRVIAEQRAIENNVETRTEKMARARLLIMRLIQARETKPEHSWTTTSWEAERLISENNLWVGIGNAYRKIDGGYNFNANMNLLMMLPLNIEMERHILNIYARTIVDGIDYYEQQMKELDEKVWADELWEKIISAGYEESEKQDDYWAKRQQATLFESQQEFAKFVKEKKKKR